MNKSNRFFAEVRERAARMVQEHRGEYPFQWAACAIATQWHLPSTFIVASAISNVFIIARSSAVMFLDTSGVPASKRSL
jgi:hypothetical protein